MPGLIKAKCSSKLCKLILLLLACLVLVTCKQLESDRSYLEGIPCTAPCWQGITPGITDETTAMTILSNPELVFQDTLDCRNSTDNSLRRSCTFRRVSNQGGNIGFENGIVWGIGLKSEVTLGEILNTLGPPDFIDAMYGSQVVNEGKCYRANVYYLKGIYLLVSGCEPIEFPLEVVSGNNLRVFPDMQIISIDFLPPSDSIETTLLNLFGHSDIQQQWDIQRYLDNVQTWTGFGLYSLPPGE